VGFSFGKEKRGPRAATNRREQHPLIGKTGRRRVATPRGLLAQKKTTLQDPVGKKKKAQRVNTMERKKKENTEDCRVSGQMAR